MPNLPPNIQQLLTALADAPAHIAASTAGLTPVQAKTSPTKDEWSINEVLAHLRSCDDMWGGYIRVILAEDHPTIRAMNPRTWIRQTDYPQQPFHASLQVFTIQRAALVAVLESLEHEQWLRSATVTGAGKPFVHTVLSYAERLAQHERPHLKQIQRDANTLW